MQKQHVLTSSSVIHVGEVSYRFNLICLLNQINKSKIRSKIVKTFNVLNNITTLSTFFTWKTKELAISLFPQTTNVVSLSSFLKEVKNKPPSTLALERGQLKAPRLFFPNKDLWSFDVNISKIMPLTVAFKSMQVYTLMEVSFKATYLCFVFFIIYKWILNQKQIVQLNKKCSCKVVDLQRVLSGTQGLTHFISLLACKTVTLFLKTSFPSNAPEPHT